jgi:hypothetical protein
LIGLAACSIVTDLSDLSCPTCSDASASDAAGDGGEAGPTLLATVDAPWMMAIDDTSIYWTDTTTQTVAKASKVDGSNLVTLAKGESAAGFYPQGIALDAAFVYWCDATGFVRKCAKSGCQNNPETIASAPPNTSTQYLTVDATDVYFVTQDGHVLRVPKTGGLVQQLAYLPGMAAMIIADASFVYVSFEDGSIRKLAKGGGGPVTDAGTPDAAQLITGSASPESAYGMLLVGTRIYYSNSVALGQLSYVDVNGFDAGSGTIAAQQNFPWGLATDGPTLYWTNFGDYLANSPNGSIMKCAFGNCVPTVVASGQQIPRFVASDDQAIYWATGGNQRSGGVWRLAK